MPIRAAVARRASLMPRVLGAMAMAPQDAYVARSSSANRTSGSRRMDGGKMHITSPSG
jgi:hypothetical protein